MITAGIRDLRNHLSQHLKAVRNGDEIVVTDHGEPIARIVKEPRKEPSWRDKIAPLAAKGLVRLPTRERERDIPRPRSLPGKPLSEIIVEDRR